MKISFYCYKKTNFENIKNKNTSLSSNNFLCFLFSRIENRNKYALCFFFMFSFFSLVSFEDWNGRKNLFWLEGHCWNGSSRVTCFGIGQSVEGPLRPKWNFVGLHLIVSHVPSIKKKFQELYDEIKSVFVDDLKKVSIFSNTTKIFDLTVK